MTERLYYSDSHLYKFTAKVTSCEAKGGGYCVTLDRSAFFPEGGGQRGDAGYIGGVRVIDTQEAAGEVFHIAEAPLAVGESFDCELCWDTRFSRMQSHSGEHVVSGIVHNLYGFDNVGFHMGADGMIVDFSGFLSDDEIRDIELRANRVIWDNRRVTASFPEPDELKNIEYRSKLELTENVRIVEIEGVDLCACCAPHVSFTGEIGLIRILESIRRKDGVRIRMLAGRDAYLDATARCLELGRVSSLLSAKAEGTCDAVSRLMKQRDELSYRLGGFKRKEIADFAAALEPTDGNVLLFRPDYDLDELRLLVNAVLPKCGGMVCGFTGSDAEGYKYIIAKSGGDLRAKAKELNSALNGRGGGKPEMIQGSFSATEDEIRKVLS